jgi:hypothetical protein
MRGSEPFHRICADCAANGRKCYLQQHIRGPYYDEFRWMLEMQLRSLSTRPTCGAKVR